MGNSLARRHYERVPDAEEGPRPSLWRRMRWPLMVVALVFLTLGVIMVPLGLRHKVEAQAAQHAAEYDLTHDQTPEDFLQHYTFYTGPDANGSKGLQTYVGGDLATGFAILNVTDGVLGITPQWKDPASANADSELLSVRLEGKRTLNSGLFVFDVDHMPVGCGLWPAIWLTNEDMWPEDGEIDVIEGVNLQDRAATALHTKANCTMATVPSSAMTGVWDVAEGVPDKWTGQPTPGRHEARDCFAFAEDQWMNQGCVARDTTRDTFGHGMNKKGGGLFVLEWDPDGTTPPFSGEAGNARMHGGFIRSWAFTPRHSAPHNLREALAGGGSLLPDTWPRPYAYFHLNGADLPLEDARHHHEPACSSDHFQNMHLVINTAFCGVVAGEKFRLDCPAEFKKYHEPGEASIKTCERYVRSEDSSLADAQWRIRSIKVYERTKQ